jgi:hypothetical protein
MSNSNLPTRNMAEIRAELARQKRQSERAQAVLELCHLLQIKAAEMLHEAETLSDNDDAHMAKLKELSEAVARYINDREQPA